MSTQYCASRVDVKRIGFACRRAVACLVITAVCLLGYGCSESSDSPVEAPGLPLGPLGPIIEVPVRLSGSDADPAAEAIPLLAYEGKSQDYSDDHPDFPGLFVSYRVILLAFHLDTTVGEANEILEAIDAEIVGGLPGVASESEGIIVLRVKASDHDELALILQSLGSDLRVLSVAPDVLFEPTVCTPLDPKTQARWSWEDTPQGKNWGLELSRVPQMWNLNAALEKSGGRTFVGVLDTGFHPNHEDLVYVENQTPGRIEFHGTHVAGIIGATFGNGLGVDGINPFSDLIVRGARFWVSSDPYIGRASMGEIMCSELFALFQNHDEIGVINISLGYNWLEKGVNTNGNTRVHELVGAQGKIFSLSQNLWHVVGHSRPLIVSSAGNDSSRDPAWGDQDARWASPINNAALEHGVSNIFVIESISNTPGAMGGATRAISSAVGGHFSAPGVEILSTYWFKADPGNEAAYDLKSGTSMASPHVAGLVSYLLAIDADLNHDQLRELLFLNGEEVDGRAKKRVDAFASALDIDRIRGNDAVLRMMLDIDDGTSDGNCRVNLERSEVFLGEDADGDGGVGDGSIDMADFRRWRDWLLYVEQEPDLDGGTDHPKKDVNENGEVEFGFFENIYPRGDFNGDGKLSLDATSYVPGAVQADLTDLDVLQLLFDDPDYDEADLPDLVHSADIEIEVAGCFDMAGAWRVESSIWIPDEDAPFQTHRYSDDATSFIHTIPEFHGGEYLVRVEVLDASEGVIAAKQEMFPCTLGSDARWEPFADLAGLRWEFNTDQPIKTKVAIAGNGTIYVASDKLHALNPDGSEKWVYDICGLGWSSPTIDPLLDRIYIGIFAAQKAGLAAIEPWGEPAWIFRTELFNGASFFASPAVDSMGKVYAIASDDYLYRIDPVLGYMDWRFRISTGGFLPISSPAIDDRRETIYVGCGGAANDGNYYLLALTYNDNDADSKWLFPTGGPIRSSPAIGSDGTVYVGCDDDFLYAVAPGGTGLWTFQTERDVVTSPAIGEDGTIYIGSEDSHLYALNPDGTEKWRFETPRAIESSPAVGADGTIYVGSGDEYLYAIFPDGKLKWRYLTDRDIQRRYPLNGSPAISENGTIYIGSENTNLYAIDGKPDIPGLADSIWPECHRDNRNSQRVPAP